MQENKDETLMNVDSTIVTEANGIPVVESNTTEVKEEIIETDTPVENIKPINIDTTSKEHSETSNEHIETPIESITSINIDIVAETPTEKPTETKSNESIENIEKIESKDDSSDSDSSSSDSSDSSSSDSDSSSSDSSDDLDDIVEVKKNNNNNNRKRKLEYDDSGEPISNKPPRTRNEVVELPSEEALNIQIPSHIQLEEIGIFSHIIDDMLIIKSNKVSNSALDLDSIVFNKNRIAIGRIHDVFGPVSNPVYSIRMPENIEFILKSKMSNETMIESNDQPETNITKEEPQSTSTEQPLESTTTTPTITPTEITTEGNNNLETKMECQSTESKEIPTETQPQPKQKPLKRKIILDDNEPIYFVNLPDLSKFVVASEIYTKGFDASNEFDEEINESDQEFSDDEKEKLYKSNKKFSRRKLNNNNNVQQPNNQQPRNNNNNNRRNRNRNISQLQPNLPTNSSLDYTPLTRQAPTQNQQQQYPQHQQNQQQVQQLNLQFQHYPYHQPILPKLAAQQYPQQPQAPQQQNQTPQQPSLQFQQLLQQYTQYHNMRNSDNS